MHLTDHMRKQLLDSVIAAQKEDNPLLEGLDLHRLQKTLEKDLSSEELFSIIMMVGGHPIGSGVRPDSVAKPTPVTPSAALTQSKSENRRWKVERPTHVGMFKSLTHRSQIGR